MKQIKTLEATKKEIFKIADEIHSSSGCGEEGQIKAIEVALEIHRAWVASLHVLSYLNKGDDSRAAKAAD